MNNSKERAAARAWLLAGAVVLLVAGGGLWWFLSGDEPEAVDLESATAALPASTTMVEEQPQTTEGTEPVASGVDGTWTVDTSIGSFSFEDATGSFVGFRVAEELAGIGATEAVGRTPEVSGTIEIEGTTLASASIEADFTAIVSNDGRRDNRIQGSLDTDQFPTASFLLTKPVDLGGVPAEGEPIAVTATGDLTIHGITNSVDIPLEAQLVGETIVVVGSTEVVFADYDVEAPTAVIVLSVEDRGLIELQLFFTR